jgi:transcriptional regulator with GAF, ATPase, and Fis domain
MIPILDISKKIIEQTNANTLISYVLGLLLEELPCHKAYFISYIGFEWKIVAEQTSTTQTIFREADSIIYDGILLQHEKYFLKRLETVIFHKKYDRIPSGDVSLAKSMVAFPVLYDKNVAHIVVIENIETENAFTTDQCEWIENILPYFSISLLANQQTADLKKQTGNFERMVANLQEELAIKDAALNQQQDEVLRAYENLRLLSQIGQTIAANLSVEKIIAVTYENLNKLIDAPVFNIGVYNKGANRLDFLGTIENGKRLPAHYFSLDDDSKLAVWSFKNQQEVLINDIAKDFSVYLPTTPAPANFSRNTQSLIYLPLVLNEEVLGVINVQSYTKNAYNRYHVNILRNLAVYVAIALENAEAYHNISVNNLEIAQQKQLIEQQKEAIEKSYNNIRVMGEMGKAITSCLSVKSIVEVAYENINQLLDASVFCIGTYNNRKNLLEFFDGKENGKPMKNVVIKLEEDRLATWCFRNVKPIVINDIETEHEKYLKGRFKPLAGVSSVSVIYLPLVDKNDGTVLGVITVQSPQKNAYNDYHLTLLNHLALYVSIAIDNALLYQNLEEKVIERTSQVLSQKEEIEKAYHHVKLLSEIGAAITTTLSVDTIIGTTYENVNQLMDAAAFAVGVINETTGRIEFRGGMEKGQPLEPFFHDINDDLRFSVWTIRNRKAVFINDYHKEYINYIPALKPPAAGEDPESLIYLPLITQDKVVGVMTVQSFHSHAYTEYHLDILKNLSLYMAIALGNARAYKQIEQQKEDLEKINQKQTSSINYALRIQESLLYESQNLQSISLKDYFVVFRPKDIVSGDFYWIREKGSKLFVAAVDCTGHGVPGAFMSIIGNGLLNEIVLLRGIYSPDLILELLHDCIRQALQQVETNNRDGMDVAFCVLDKQTRKVEYAGAMNPLIYVEPSTNEVITIRADKNSIGGVQRDGTAARTFTLHEVAQTEQPRMFYLFSDGFQDQFGGGGRKFGLPRMKELFAQIHTLPTEEQKVRMETELDKWKGTELQIDDILLIGFRF